MFGQRPTGKFLYWSDRAIQTVASENGVELRGRPSWSVNVNLKFLQFGTKPPENPTRDLLEESKRLEAAIPAVADFDTPPRAHFAKGCDSVSFAKFDNPYAKNEGALLHVRTYSQSGRRVDLCLFGSMDNVRGFAPYDSFPHGWTSSSAAPIGELVTSRGKENTAHWLNDKDKCIEALKVALYQGSTGRDEEHEGRPASRGFTVGHADRCEYFAEIYADVLLGKDDKRHVHDELALAERIMIGRPLWVRSLAPGSVVRYAEVRRRKVRQKANILRRAGIIGNAEQLEHQPQQGQTMIW
ncbi:hypothetical protein GPX89_05045 [Nocardia sp. ET3-3]|uniref:Uncharacterized protein n=1 Tax=Nocardia terrae TaxID=2675851 RepID=A0A7K1UQI7_9NOCA|nr:hypothetical protein [Nocardia terrae]MVU76610.1 hypothetical protein [Nocardia terrae]